MRIALWLFIPFFSSAHGADSFSKKPILKPVTLQPTSQPTSKLKPLPLVAPGSTYRSKPEPILKPEPSFKSVDVKPVPLESDLKKIKSKKIEAIQLKIKKAPLPEPSSLEKKN